MKKDKVKVKLFVNGINVATRNRDGEITFFKDKDPQPIVPMSEEDAMEKALSFNERMKDLL